MKLEIEPFTLGENVIQEVSVRKMYFLEYAEMASSLVGIKNAQKAYQRARIKAAVTFLVDGKQLAPTDEQITLLPIPIMRKIINGFDPSDEEPGKLLSGKEADGINAPMLYKLGTPIMFKRGNEDVAITELEFHATTYGDVEDIIAVDALILRGVEFIKRLARPVGIPGMLTFPASSLSRITIPDGLRITQDIMPNFTE